MKVSLLTYHDEDNYGATLQAYATCRAIKELGFDPEIINLHMRREASIVSKIVFSLKRFRFNDFRKKHMSNVTRVYHSLAELQLDPPKSSVYMVGSDQTWNPTISKEYALAYFLDFGSDHIRRVSYAASFGTSSWVDSKYADKETVGKLLSRLNHITVRENTGVELLEKEFGLKSVQVVDPVLLFSSYPELTGESRQSDEMVLYKIVDDAIFYNKAVELGASLGCNVRCVGSLRHPRGVKVSYPERIEKWITRLASAKYVFTDSFHGTVLSLIYHRQFVVYVGAKEKMSRLVSLLYLVGLEGRIVSSEDAIDKIQQIMLTPIDYSLVDSKLNHERAFSIGYLRMMLQDIGRADESPCSGKVGLKRFLVKFPFVNYFQGIRSANRENNELKARSSFIPKLASLIDKDTSIITNNCFAGRIMQDLGMQYNSPTLGLYIWFPDYIEFLSNLKHYLTSAELTFVEHSKYPLGDTRRAQWSHWYPIGLLDDKVEIAFLHYHSEDEAAEKWHRRAARVNFDKLVVIGMEQNLCSLSDIFEFDSLPYENKIFFSSRYLPTCSSNVYLSQFDGKDEVGDAYRMSDIYYKALIDKFDGVI